MNRRSMFTGLMALAGSAAAAQKKPPVARLEWVEGKELVAAILHTRIEITPSMLERIMKIEGIEYGYITSRYEASLYRGDLFTWPELEPAILRAVEEGR